MLLSTIWQQFRTWPRLVALYVVSTIGLVAMWVADPLIGQWVIDNVGSLEQGALPPTFVPQFLLWLGVSAMLCVMQAAHKYICWRLMNRTYIRFMQESYRAVLHMDVMQHLSRRAGAIIKKIDNASDTLWDLGFQIFEVIVPSTITGVIFLGIAARVHAPLTAGVAALLVAYGGALLVINSKAEPLQKRVSRVWVSVVGRAYDVATNILPVKSSSSEEREVERMRALQNRAFAMQIRADRLWASLEGINMFILLRATIIGVGFLLIAQGDLTLGELFFFLFIVFRLVAPIEVIGAFLPKWNEKMEKVRMGVQMTSLPSLVTSREGAQTLSKIQGTIAFENISFSYAQAGSVVVFNDEELEEEMDILHGHTPEECQDRHCPHHPTVPMRDSESRAEEEKRKDTPRRIAISGVRFTVVPGEHIAFVGHSGSGKSTLAALINRFYDVSEGRITVDGVDLRDLDLHWWRAQVGLVLQDNTMFNDSVSANIRYARPGASDVEVMEAANRAAAHAFILNLPEGYRTVIGERGIKLSGGERQRLAIARAILKKPSVVVLDEATSALDSITEQAVQEGIRELTKGRTTFIIAHRLSTVRAVDRIAVLEQGKLIGLAPHAELLQTCGVYKEMVELQSHGLLAE
jgi:ABC-type multidrug transport system fused ATPase/permease subunit